MRPAGFTRFEFRELDGKVGQALFVFGDDFTLLTPDPTPVGDPPRPLGTPLVGPSPNPSRGRTTLRFSLPPRAVADLSIYDARGRLVRMLTGGMRGEGWHAVTWDGRDRDGRDVAAGVYFARLVAVRGEHRDVSMRKIVVRR